MTSSFARSSRYCWRPRQPVCSASSRVVAQQLTCPQPSKASRSACPAQVKAQFWSGESIFNARSVPFATQPMFEL